MLNLTKMWVGKKIIKEIVTAGDLRLHLRIQGFTPVLQKTYVGVVIGNSRVQNLAKIQTDYFDKIIVPSA